MYRGPVPATQILDEIAVLAARALPREQFFAELAPRLRLVIDSDATCWHTLDPYTRLMTSDAPAELIERGIYTPETAPHAGELMARSEYLIEDFNTFASLSSRRVPVSSLDQATRGRPEHSTRYRELLVPSGIPHELRAAFVIRGRAWGAVHIARRQTSGPFADADAKMLALVTTAIAHAIRGSLRFDAARRADHPEAPGLLVLDTNNAVELVTPPAYDLLAAMRDEAGVYSDAAPPPAVLGLASFVRGDRHHAAPRSNHVTVPSRIGWITLHASLPDGPRTGRVAIVLEYANGPQSATLRLEVNGVSTREREVATLLARGLSNAEIAETFVLSPHTVRDHIKSLYEKLEVGSRQELVARVFLDEYLPEVAVHTPITSKGRFELDHHGDGPKPEPAREADRSISA
ncbi:MAG: helix-turn-helix transcriptional regulator [Solirubrobacterales bacterium]|nr:helix-turn-helix transcriptional regulator [Solirubrobacterales bacterium]